MPNLPSFAEKLISQIPALHLLMALGYEYLTAAQPLRLCAGTRDVASGAWRRDPREPDAPVQQPPLLGEPKKALMEQLLRPRVRCSSSAPTTAVTLGCSTHGCMGAHIVVSYISHIAYFSGFLWPSSYLAP